MSSGLPVSTKKRPSERAIAFAISVVLSKPEELAVKDYIKLLRQHVAKGRRENAISTAYRHLDRSSYWRAEYERVKDTLKTAEGEAIDLRRECETLKAKLESSARTSSPTKKRKKVDEDVVPVPPDPKRLKLDSSTAKRQAASSDPIAEFNFASIGEVGNILMRSFYQIHTVLKSHERTEPTMLVHQCLRAASALPQVVQQALRDHQTVPRAEIESLKAVLTAAGRCVLSLIMGFNRLSHVANEAEMQGHVTYAYVQMYAKFLDMLSDTATAEAKRSCSESSDVSINKQSASKAKSKPPKPTNIKNNPTLNLLTSFVCNIIDHFDPKIEAHKALFEGFAYIVLEKLGPQLYLLVFGSEKGETVEDQITLKGLPDEIQDQDESSTHRATDPQTLVARLQAPYLIHLLARVMNAAPSHFGAVINSKTGKAKQANSKGFPKGALTIVAKERLQRTLVNCMFGTEDVDENDPFMDCLKMPVLSSTALAMPKIKEPEVNDWFKEEVWRLLGWEILSREKDW